MVQLALVDNGVHARTVFDYLGPQARFNDPGVGALMEQCPAWRRVADATPWFTNTVDITIKFSWFSDNVVFRKDTEGQEPEDLLTIEDRQVDGISQEVRRRILNGRFRAIEIECNLGDEVERIRTTSCLLAGVECISFECLRVVPYDVTEIPNLEPALTELTTHPGFQDLRVLDLDCWSVETARLLIRLCPTITTFKLCYRGITFRKLQLSSLVVGALQRRAPHHPSIQRVEIWMWRGGVDSALRDGQLERNFVPGGYHFYPAVEVNPLTGLTPWRIVLVFNEPTTGDCS